MAINYAPLISILIPCYNAGLWVEQAINSALAQSWFRKEVIVIDDGSTDNSLEVIKSFEGKVRFESGPNRGGNVARNRLLGMAQGEWLQYLDADDYLLPTKIYDQVQCLNANPEADLIYGPSLMTNFEATLPTLLPIPEPHDLWVLLARWYLPQTGATLWRKAAIQDVGGWKEDQPCCQEHELYLRLLIKNKRFSYCPIPGSVYRQWGEHTVCKRDKPELVRRRLEILNRAEDVIKERQLLTSERLQSINMGRFEMARTIWPTEPTEALQIISKVLQSQPGFVPRGTAAPRSYRLAWRCLGFKGAENLAYIRRKWVSELRRDT